MANNRIASCSQDKTIKIRNGNPPYYLIKTISGHKNYVTSILQIKNYELLISGSKDETLRTWNSYTYVINKIINNIDCCSSNSLIEVDNSKIIVGGENLISIVNMMEYRTSCK